MISCPKCGSMRLQRKGSRAGKQRYRCSICKCNFTEGVEYKPQNHYNPIEGITCPKCGGDHIMRDGKLESGAIRYMCFDCRKRFSEKTNRELKPIEYNCPYCNGKLTYSGYGKLGQREYLCVDCGKSCSADKQGKPIKRITFEEQNTTIVCPSCGSLKIKAAGYRDGIKRYICKECKKAFSENTKPGPKYYQHSPEIIKNAVDEILNGGIVNIVAVKYGYNIRTLQNIVRPYYKKENLSPQTKNSIISLGICGVTPEELAPHMKCSVFQCKKLLKPYKNIKKKKYKRSEQEKAQDFMILNKYIG